MTDPFQQSSTQPASFTGKVDPLLATSIIGALGISITALIISIIALSESRKAKSTLKKLIKRKGPKSTPLTNRSKDKSTASPKTHSPPPPPPKAIAVISQLEPDKAQAPRLEAFIPSNTEQIPLNALPETLEDPEPNLEQKKTATPGSVLDGKHELNIKDLVNALNTGNRQQLREMITVRLNITSDSENALSIGRYQPTQLEVVGGGGSYWLAVISDQAWLFPTELTLKGFLSVQPDKGLYSYEKQIISSPQLIEPALLRQDGNLWTVETLGRVAIP